MSGPLGQPASRVDGVQKVTGKAPFTADFRQKDQIYAFPIRATVGLGEVLSFAEEAARKVPGFLKLITHLNQPSFEGPSYPPAPPNRPDAKIRYLLGPKIEFFGQFIGVVVAESYEAARQAASLVEVEYRTDSPRIDFETYRPEAFKTEKINVGKPADELHLSLIHI